MGKSVRDKINELLQEVSSMDEIKAIGETGDNNFIPKAAGSCEARLRT